MAPVDQASNRSAVRLRPIDPAVDLPRLAELTNTVSLEPVKVRDLLEEIEKAPAEETRRLMAAVDEDGRIAGFSDAVREPWMKPGEFYLSIVVDPGARRGGIGTVLYDDAHRFLQEQGATRLRTRVRDDMPESRRFAERRGFVIDRHVYASTLDLTTFDERPFAGRVERAEAQGIRFLTLADAGNTVEAQRKLYELNRRTGRDIPGSDGTFPPFEDFRRFVFEARWFRADGQILAADGDRWVGLAAVGYTEETRMAYNAFTGVDREYRGQGLALALKLLAIRRAREFGATSMRTGNDSQNAPILAINRNLGYRPEPGRYRMVRAL